MTQPQSEKEYFRSRETETDTEYGTGILFEEPNATYPFPGGYGMDMDIYLKNRTPPGAAH